MGTVEPSRAQNSSSEGATLRERIVAAARELLEETGSDDAVTLRGIARRVGVTAPAIYTHFPDRYAILRRVVTDAFAELAAAMSIAGTAQTDPIDRLRAVCGAYLAFAVERPHHYRVLFERHRTSSVGVRGSAEANTDVKTMVGADAFGTLLDATKACIDAGRSTARDPMEATNRIWIGLHGQATLQASLPWHPWPNADELKNQLLTRLGDLTTEMHFPAWPPEQH